MPSIKKINQSLQNKIQDYFNSASTNLFDNLIFTNNINIKTTH